MTANRDQRRQGERAIKGLKLEPRRLIIAGLQVLTSNAIPTGAMVVNPAEADVLQALVDEASNKKAIDEANANDTVKEEAENASDDNGGQKASL